MTTIERLRDLAHESLAHPYAAQLCITAAAELESLQAENAALKDKLETCQHYASVGKVLSVAEYHKMFP